MQDDERGDEFRRRRNASWPLSCYVVRCRRVWWHAPGALTPGGLWRWQGSTLPTCACP